MQLTVRDAASLLEIEEDEIYRFIDERTIPFYEVNDQYRFNRAELLAWATANGRRVSPEVIHKLGASQSGLAELLAVHRDIEAEDHASMVRAAVERLPIESASERELVISVLSSTNPARSTIGDGIAIPHARSPIVLPGGRSAVSLCFLKKALDLGASDGKPIATIFMILTPTPKAHLQLLSKLSTALLNAAFKEAVKRRAPTEEILAAAREVDAAIAARGPSATRLHG